MATFECDMKPMHVRAQASCRSQAAAMTGWASMEDTPTNAWAVESDCFRAMKSRCEASFHARKRVACAPKS